MVFGTLLTSWARIVRGNYAASWGLNETIPLIKSGPYRSIRHPTYSFQILVFIGFPLFTLFWPSIICLVGIYGYVNATIAEEELLIKHFGDEYKKYQEKTSKFITKLY